MAGNSALISSSIAKKYWMALTGLFLCTFLVVHLIGNLQLLYNDGGEAFNVYAEFMTTFPLIKIVSYVLYASILFHAIDGILLMAQNRKARGTRYVKSSPGNSSPWTSRYMGQLGIILLAFIIVHMAQFWGKMHFAEMPMAEYAGLDAPIKDLYTVVVDLYTGEMGIIWVAVYVFCMAAIGFHLSHGFQSAFQSMGWNHPKYTPIIKKAGMMFSVLISIAFACIPVIIFITKG